MKIKAIDLINRCLCRDDTLPKKIIYKGIEFTFNTNSYFPYFYDTDKGVNFMSVIEYFQDLEEEVEIVEVLEEDKEIEYKPIQELKNKRFTNNQKQIAGKINEIIKTLNELKKGK